MGRVDTKGWVGKGLGLVGGIAGSFAGPLGGMAGAAAGQALGGVVDSYAAENAAKIERTAGMFGGPRTRPIPADALKPTTETPDLSEFANMTPAVAPMRDPRRQVAPAPVSLRPAKTQVS